MTVENGTGSANSKEEQDHRTLPFTYPHPEASLVILQVKQLQWVSEWAIWAVYAFTVNVMKHKKKTWGERETLRWFFGLTSLANAAQWVWKPQGNDKGESHRVIFLPLWYLSNIRRAKIHFQISPQRFLDVLCCHKLLVRDKSTSCVFLSEVISDLNMAQDQYWWLNNRDLNVENMIIQKAITGEIQSNCLNAVWNMLHLPNSVHL